MKIDRAITIIARNIVANNDTAETARIIHSAIGADLVNQVIDRASEIREDMLEDMLPDREKFKEAWELLRSKP